MTRKFSVCATVSNKFKRNTDVVEFILQMKLILYNRLQFSAGVSKTDEWANRISFPHNNVQKVLLMEPSWKSMLLPMKKDAKKVCAVDSWKNCSFKKYLLKMIWLYAVRSCTLYLLYFAVQNSHASNTFIFIHQNRIEKQEFG